MNENSETELRKALEDAHDWIRLNGKDGSEFWEKAAGRRRLRPLQHWKPKRKARRRSDGCKNQNLQSGRN